MPLIKDSKWNFKLWKKKLITLNKTDRNYLNILRIWKIKIVNYKTKTLYKKVIKCRFQVLKKLQMFKEQNNTIKN